MAVDHGNDRYGDYRGPSHDGPHPVREARTPDNPRLTSFERYKEFLVQELKPSIDAEFRTLSDPRNTAVVGSSLGGICSLALAWDRPDVFGNVGSLSGAFQVGRTHFIRRFLIPFQGPPKPFRCYLDSGIIDYTGGDDGRDNTWRVVQELRRIGWKDGVDLKYLLDDQPRSADQLREAGLTESKWPEARTNQHNEFYWRLRFAGVLQFLFPGSAA